MQYQCAPTKPLHASQNRCYRTKPSNTRSTPTVTAQNTGQHHATPALPPRSRSARNDRPMFLHSAVEKAS
eukprot:14935136-Alexandrium_andersonii.AAC.1